MKQLIVNGDDFGIAPGVNRAIVRAHREGILSSTTMLANGAAFDQAVAAARENPRLGVGVHLNLTQGPPLSDARTLGALLDGHGEFLGHAEPLYFRMMLGRVAQGAVEQEFRAQIERVRNAGIQPTHLDGHQHVHMWPPVFAVTARLAAEYGLAGVRSARERRVDFHGLWRRNTGFRGTILQQAGVGLGLAFLSVTSRAALAKAGVATPDYFYGVSATGFLNRGTLEDILRDVPDGVSELMAHPGYVDAALKQVETRLVEQREMELDALTWPRARILIEEMGIQLVTYRALKARPAE